MSLQLDIKHLEGLPGKGERMIKAKFRDHEISTKVVKGQNAVYFGVELLWKVARRIEANDNLTITAYEIIKYLPKKVIGSVTINLASIITRQVLNLDERLVDSNKVVTTVSLSFDVFYRPPDQGELGLDSDRFNLPLTNIDDIKDVDDLDQGEGEGKYGEEQNMVDMFGLGEAGAGDEMDALSEHSSILSAPIKRDPRLKPVVGATVHKPETFTVTVTVIEARDLIGTNINPIVAVTAAGKTRKTDVKMYTNSPYFNKFFNFEYFLPRSAVMDEVIWIRAFSLRSQIIARVLPGKFIGEFVIDVRSIYETKGHFLTNKWAVLIDPKHPLQGPVGYVRVDLAFLGKDDVPRHIKHEKAEDDSNIEGNLLVPKGISNLKKRNITEFSVKIYRAEGLPPMNTDIITSIKQAFVGDGAPMCDPYVEVSFGGHVGKTKVKKFTYTPIWNQEVIFADFFPPLTHSIRLCIKDHDALKDEIIATHVIDLKHIMNTNNENQMPTFGPSWVNLYGTKRTYTYAQMRRPEDELNKGLGDGVAYRGRLLMAIKAAPSKDMMKTGAVVRVTPSVSELVAGRKSQYLLFLAFYGVSVVDPEIGKLNAPIQFEVSIGTYGNKIDGKKGGIVLPPVRPAEHLQDSNGRKEDREKVTWDHSLTSPMKLVTENGIYYHVDFNGTQPCLFLLNEFEDHRLRMCIPNILEKVRNEYAAAVDQIHYLINRRKKGSARHRFRQILLYKSKIFRKAANDVRLCRGTAPKTMLDLSYQRRVRTDLLRIELRLKRLGKKLHGYDINKAMREVRAIITRLGELINCPQHGLPDVFVWMIMNNQRIGFVRIPSREIYFSVSEPERGKFNSQINTHFVRKPGHLGVGQKGWRIQCQLQMYTWLGLVKDYRKYKDGLPEGYDTRCIANLSPPKDLIYLDSSVFELRCYIYLAKNLLASNNTGFSDPIARILVNNEMLQTFAIYDTMSPLWDLTLIKTNITFHHHPAGVKLNPPQIVVEFFDINVPMFGSSVKSNPYTIFNMDETNYLGRCFCEANIVTEGDEYKPPSLQWWQIYRGQSTSGKLLACFDLIQLEVLDDLQEVPEVEDLLDFTRRFNERILLGPNCGIPFSDDSDDYRDDSDVAADDEEMKQAARLLDENAMAELQEPLDDVASTAGTMDDFEVRSVTSTATNRRRKKTKKTKVGLSTADLVRWRGDNHLRLPENIRPPLGRYRLEVIFWGVRELRRQFLLPVNRPIVTVEVGGTKVVSDLLRSAKINPLFEKRLKFIDLYLPLDEQLWPPITIICHDNRLFDKKITVGLCTLPSPTDYFEKAHLAVYDEHEDSSTVIETDSDEVKEVEEDAKTKRRRGMRGKRQSTENGSETDDESLKAGGFGTLAPKAARQTSGTSSDEETAASHEPPASHAGSFKDTDPIMKGERSMTKSGTMGGPGGAQAFPANPMLKMSKKVLETLDWWSRLYVSLNDIDDENEEGDTHDEDSEASSLDEKLEAIELDPEEIGQVETAEAEIPDDAELGASKKRKNRIRKFFHLKPKKELTALERFEKEKEKKKKKKKRKAKATPQYLVKKLKGDAKKSFMKEMTGDLIFSTPNLDDSLIQRVKIIASDLEDVPSYGGFTTPIRNFCLYRGKQDEEDISMEQRAVGYFKGNIKLYPVAENAESPDSVEDLHSFSMLPKRVNFKILARVYIVRALSLHPTDSSGISDPYLIVSLGKHIMNDRQDYITKTIQPTFGKLFQFEVDFPIDTVLHVQVYDHDIFGSDDMIGQTTIDLESRFHSPHRATCGLPSFYCSHGYAQWRDSKQPTEILLELCNQKNLPDPIYNQLDNSVKIGTNTFFADATIIDETEATKKSNEPLALAALNNWRQIENQMELVPEHVEIRKLTHPEKGTMEQGRLMMWVDLFDRDEGKPPPAIDISPRNPEPWELRVIIHNTSDVILNDTSLFSNEKSSDIYVRGWMKGVGEDDQKTDVHYRSLSGEGNFNWRFVFPFSYLRYEDRITFPQKGTFDLEPVEVKMPCDLTLQVWDAELVRTDNFLGSLALKLSKMPRPAKTAASCGLHQLDPSCPVLSMFENKSIRGWWPLVMKDDEEDELLVQGKVEAEITLVSGTDAESSPVGKAREEPEALTPPNRPDSSFMTFLGPLNTIRYLIKYKLKWLLLKLLVAFLLILIIFLLIYTSPGWISKKIWNA